MVYLTFDDGPIPEITPWVLDLLEHFSIKATFFCVGDNVEKFPEVYKRVLSEGHITGNHTFNHVKGFFQNTKDYVSNVNRAEGLIKSNIFRPPHGQIKLSQYNILKKKYKLIFWDVLVGDWDRKRSGERCFETVKKKVRNGSVIVFHDSKKASKNLRYALPKTIEYLINSGYRFETLNFNFIKG